MNMRSRRDIGASYVWQACLGLTAWCVVVAHPAEAIAAVNRAITPGQEGDRGIRPAFRAYYGMHCARRVPVPTTHPLVGAPGRAASLASLWLINVAP